MNTPRKDGWTSNEDNILLTVAVTYLEEGKSLKQAFIEVSDKIERRTPESCSFRYFANIAKENSHEVEAAKQKGLLKKKEIQMQKRYKATAENKQKEETTTLPSVQVETIERVEVVDKTPTLESIMKDIRSISNLDKIEKIEEENKALKQDKEDLKQENITLKEQNNLLRSQLDQISQVFKRVKQIG